jgi:hypothetical protein
MVPARDDAPDLFRAYRAAWSDREATGDNSDDVLLRRLALEGIVDLDAKTQELLLDMWRRGVKPRHLGREMVKGGLVPLLRAARSVYYAFTDPSRIAPDIVELIFEQAISDDELLSLSEDWTKDDVGDLRAVITLAPDEASSGFRVELDGVLLGRAPAVDDMALADEAELFVVVRAGRVTSVELVARPG